MNIAFSSFFRFTAAGCALASSLFFAGCSGSPTADAPADNAPGVPEDVKASLDGYESKMTDLLELLGESDDPAAIQTATRELVEQSLPILDGFIAMHPDSRAYLEASKEVVDRMDEISAEEIEEEYHLDKALPEGTSEAYHVKDLLVHPATVIVLLREGELEENREDMTREIQENQAHLESVRVSLKSIQ